jgi:hypothetical protein
MNDILNWLIENRTELYSVGVSIIAIIGAKASWQHKAFEVAAELNQQRHRANWNEAVKRLNEAADDAEEFIVEKSADLDWGQAKLLSLSRDKATREAAKRRLDELQMPDFLKGKL